ncbi:hypothetical protein [Pseudomonas veronii]|uniref:hypothetical protein n=1 Tax=Pseudomonas veronii TaxID=76761 RepID=UPI0021C1736D|nr:hypothetical protein [Pseudomonas veronii]MCT9825459.1 hypothetical protein [Pseudomonas veronii]
MITTHMGSLSAAHRGYAYQDLVTAYLLVRALVHQHEAVIVDRKTVEDDRFDDLEVTANGTRIRRQLKSSLNPDVALKLQDFTGHASSLRFDRLVQTFTHAGMDAADEYRLCATWQTPVIADALSALFEVSDAAGTFAGFTTKRYRIDSARIWPDAEGPKLSVLCPSKEGPAPLTRDQVVAFCERFVIELALPSATLDLDSPGPLEDLLLDLLKKDVGIGRYPNAERRPEDVAALAIHIATNARIQGERLTPGDVASRLMLRTDFGRVLQQFPIDNSVLQPRPHVRDDLAETVLQGGVHLILAGPGSGKSWELTQLANFLRNRGVVVAQHYCFLAPGDGLAEKRISTNILFANLLGDIQDWLSEQESVSARQIFAAGADVLEKSLQQVVESGSRVVIIVDGLDHIARVRSTSQNLNDNDTDIVERLSTLALPAGVSLVIGSQPGEHLDPLRDRFKDSLHQHTLQTWQREEIFSLCDKHGVSQAFESVAISDQGERSELLTLLASKAQGNPLYTRYLSVGLVEGLKNGRIQAPHEWLSSAPALDGDITRYYQHLNLTASRNTIPVANILGVLDFSVTEAELQEIVGSLMQDYVPEALAMLSPILSHATGQGGVRIFHESFRRFILDELQAAGKSIRNILNPVIAWLESKDFFQDARSYRFLLPSLRRVGRDDEILGRVSATFARDSLVHGHSRTSIEDGVSLAADIAASSGNWPVLLRCSEIFRSLDMCFDEGTNRWHPYWITYQALHGPHALAQRMLFDGEPTLDATQGLLACEAVEAQGAVAPWAEYLELWFDDQRSSHSDHFDPEADLYEEEKVYLASLRGQLRLGYTFGVAREVCDQLYFEEELKFIFVRKLSSMLSHELPLSSVERLAGRVRIQSDQRFGLSEERACATWLGLSDAAWDASNLVAAVDYANNALRHARGVEQAVWCLERGASIENGQPFLVEPATFDIALDDDGYLHSSQPVRDWVATIRLHALIGNLQTLDAERHRVDGEGWYRCWLRFVIASAGAEAAATQNRPYDSSTVFAELLGDVRPFVGSPRACDLYRIHSVIAESLARALNFSRTLEDWEYAISSISEARLGTATQMDREDGGPISANTFFSILIPYAIHESASQLVIDALDRVLVDEERDGGTYYSNHAEFSMRVAQALAVAGQPEAATSYWRQSCGYLLGYGFHKDTSLFDLIGSVSALKSGASTAALDGLIKLQPLVRAVRNHTDGRETRNAPNAWFSALMAVDPVRGVRLLASSLAREHGGESWITVSALTSTLTTLAETADPLLLDGFWSTILFEVDHDGAGSKLVMERLRPIERLLPSNLSYVQERFTQLCAEVLDDATRYRFDAVERLLAFASEHALKAPAALRDHRHPTPVVRSESRSRKNDTTGEELRPAFPQTRSYVDVLSTLRRLGEAKISDSEVDGVVTLPLAYIISEMVDAGDELAAQRLIHFYVRDSGYWFWDRYQAINGLAAALDNAGHVQLAATSYVLAYSCAKGGGGWHNVGDRKHAASVSRALELDSAQARQVLADETARKLRSGNVHGVTQHLVEQLAEWEAPGIASQAWAEAFNVMELRLPLPGRYLGFENLETDDCDWSVEEALISLLLSRLGNPVLPRKVLILSAIARLLRDPTHLFARPLSHWLLADTSVSSLHLVLRVLIESPVDLSNLIADVTPELTLCAESDSWAVASMAQALLASIDVTVANRPEPTMLSTPVTRQPLRMSAALEQHEVMGFLAQFWPDLAYIIEERLNNVAWGDSIPGRNRWQLRGGRDGSARLPAQVLPWQMEIYLSILDSMLVSLPRPVGLPEGFESELAEEMLRYILPNIPAHLMAVASRTPRPKWEASVSNGLNPIITVADDDPEYSGWIRLGFYEVEHPQSSRTESGRQRIITRMGGIVAVHPDESVPPNAFPFNEGHIEDWLIIAGSPDEIMDERGPWLVSLSPIEDWLGRTLLLVPPASLQMLAELHHCAYADSMKWVDAAGNLAVVQRTWRVHSDQISIQDSYCIEGCDVLMRPDLIPILHQAYGPWLAELSQVM